ncbi:50S ribosomal protein L21e [archaeon]|nr:50S ribosomal protein L21e [archaeon]
MAKTKKIRQRGKISLSDYFRIYKVGDTVAIVKEKSVSSGHPERIVGKTGKIIGSRGRSKIVELNDGKKIKQFIIKPIHLKKIK